MNPRIGFSLCFIFCQCLPGASLAAENRYSDAHLHLFDFVQSTQGINAAITAMDRAGVDNAILMGIPLVKKWDDFEKRRPDYYLDNASPVYWYSVADVLLARALIDADIDERDRARFFPFLSAFNATDRNAIDHVKRMWDLYPGLWKGIGEVMTRHDDLTAFMYGEPGRANHAALNPIYAFAAQKDIPVLIHSNITSPRIEQPIYLHEIVEAVKRHPKTRFIWAHAGISRRINIDDLTDVLAETLAAHDNLWVDISWVVFNQEIAPEGVVSRNWVSLIEQFPDRFMLGSDTVAWFDNYTQTIHRYEILLSELSPKTAQAVRQDNLHRLLGIKE